MRHRSQKMNTGVCKQNERRAALRVRQAIALSFQSIMLNLHMVSILDTDSSILTVSMFKYDWF